MSRWRRLRQRAALFVSLLGDLRRALGEHRTQPRLADLEIVLVGVDLAERLRASLAAAQKNRKPAATPKAAKTTRSPKTARKKKAA